MYTNQTNVDDTCGIPLAPLFGDYYCLQRYVDCKKHDSCRRCLLVVFYSCLVSFEMIIILSILLRVSWTAWMYNVVWINAFCFTLLDTNQKTYIDSTYCVILKSENYCLTFFHPKIMLFTMKSPRQDAKPTSPHQTWHLHADQDVNVIALWTRCTIK